MASATYNWAKENYLKGTLSEILLDKMVDKKKLTAAEVKEIKAAKN